MRLALRLASLSLVLLLAGCGGEDRTSTDSAGGSPDFPAETIPEQGAPPPPEYPDEAVSADPMVADRLNGRCRRGPERLTDASDRLVASVEEIGELTLVADDLGATDLADELIGANDAFEEATNVLASSGSQEALEAHLDELGDRLDAAQAEAEQLGAEECIDLFDALRDTLL